MIRPVLPLLLSFTCGLLLSPQVSYAAPSAKSSSKSSEKSSAKSTPKKEDKAPGIKHEKYPTFISLLDKQVKDNSADYYDAVRCVLDATDGEEAAVGEWMKAAAKQGNAAATRWMLGQKLADIPQEQLLSNDIKNAYQDLKKLAAKGFVPAILDVSACLRMGIGVQKDEAAAIRNMMEGCKGGNFLARYQWLLLTKRLSAFEDKDKPEVNAEVERGNHYVIYRLATLAPDGASRFEWLKKAAEKDSGDAYFALSSLTSANHPQESYALLKNAVRLHHPEALFVLASTLISETTSNPFVQEAGIQPDPKEGRQLLKTAAMLGNIQASLTLANAYYDGSAGLPQNYEKSFFHFSNPQIASSAASAASRGIMMLRGLGTKQDTAKGLDLIKRASNAGYSHATMLLAYAYYKGLGVKASGSEAAALLSEAAATGSPEAYVYLAFITAKGGPGITADVAQAKHYVRLAAMDIGDQAQQLFDSLTVKGEWDPHP